MDSIESIGIACQLCGRELKNRSSFAFKSPTVSPDGCGSPASDSIIKCIFCALLHRPMLKRSGIAALVVGTVLTLLNQGDLILSGQWNNAFYWKIPLTYCVPFVVASYGALMNNRR
ncbi:MAG: hypothetical protein F4X65_00525 [Chloroflexi bacterium]|nr:hypothetical protein [Chloroflexota bacterium]